MAGFGGDAFWREGDEHAPVAAVDVGLPGAAEIGFEEMLVGGAEIAQAVVTGENHSVRFGTFFLNVAFGDRANFFGVGGFGAGGLAWIEAGVQRELFGAADEDEAMVGVIGRWIVFAGGDGAGFFVDEIFPMEFVAKRKCVAKKIE